MLKTCFIYEEKGWSLDEVETSSNEVIQVNRITIATGNETNRKFKFNISASQGLFYFDKKIFSMIFTQI